MILFLIISSPDVKTTCLGIASRIGGLEWYAILSLWFLLVVTGILLVPSGEEERCWQCIFPKRTNNTSTRKMTSTHFSSLILPVMLTLEKPANQTGSTGHLLCAQPHAKWGRPWGKKALIDTIIITFMMNMLDSGFFFLRNKLEVNKC